MILITICWLLMVSPFILQTCFGNKPKCEDGKDFQPELAHILGLDDMEGASECFRIYDGPVLKLFHDDTDRSETVSSEEGYHVNVDYGVTESSEFSRTYSHSKLHSDSDLIAAKLRSIMPLNAPNKRVVLALDVEPSYRHAIIMLAIIKNGYTNINVSMQLSHLRFPEILKMIDPQIVLVEKMVHRNHGHTFEELQGQKAQKNPLVILSVDERINGIGYLFSNMNEQGYDFSCSSHPCANDDGKLSPLTYPLNNEASMFFTSGSTGLPKIVVHSMCNYLRDIANKYPLIDRAPSKSVFIAEGIHSIISHKELLSCIAYGAMCIPVFLDDQFQVYDETIEDEIMEIKVEELLLKSNVTAIISPPLHLDLLAEFVTELKEEIAEEQSEEEQYCFDTVEKITAYGGKLSSSTFDKIETAFPFSEIRIMYGSSETNVIASNIIFFKNGDDRLTVHPNVQVYVSPQTQGQTEAEGELLVKTDQMMLGYLDTSGQTYQLPLCKNGWFSTGDYVRLDENGDLILLGRIRPSLNFAGDELDPTSIARSWDRFLKGMSEIKQKEELIVVRDLHHDVFGNSAVVFIQWEQTASDEEADGPSPSFVLSRSVINSLTQVLSDTSKSFYQKNANELSNNFWATSALCLVDDFPRVGSRRKVNYNELERMYMEDIKPKIFSAGYDMVHNDGNDDSCFHGDSEMFILLTSLLWDGSKYELMDWEELPKVSAHSES